MREVLSYHLAGVAVWCLAAAAVWAQEPDPKANYKQIGRSFVLAKFDADRESLTNALAPEVLLLAGHEYLKREYGINPTGDRSKSLQVKRDVLIDLDVKLYSAFPAGKRKKIKQLLAQSEYKFVIASRGGIRLNPRKAEETDEPSLVLPTKKGDVVMIVLPEPEGDYLLYVMRRSGDTWRIVMDYTD